MKTKLIYAFSAAFLLSSFAMGQQYNNQVDFGRPYSNIWSTKATVELGDSSVITVGRVEEFGAPGFFDASITKLSPGGTVLWSFEYGPSFRSEALHAVVERTSGNEVIAVGEATRPSGDIDILILCVNSTNGAVVWTKRFGVTPATEVAHAIMHIPGTTDDYIVLGRADLGGPADKIYAIRISGTGIPVWANVYDNGISTDYFRPWNMTPNLAGTGFVIIGENNVYGANYPFTYDISWGGVPIAPFMRTYTYSNPVFNGFDIDTTSSGNYIATFSTDEPSSFPAKRVTVLEMAGGTRLPIWSAHYFPLASTTGDIPQENIGLSIYENPVTLEYDIYTGHYVYGMGAVPTYPGFLTVSPGGGFVGFHFFTPPDEHEGTAMVERQTGYIGKANFRYPPSTGFSMISTDPFGFDSIGCVFYEGNEEEHELPDWPLDTPNNFMMCDTLSLLYDTTTVHGKNHDCLGGFINTFKKKATSVEDLDGSSGDRYQVYPSLLGEGQDNFTLSATVQSDVNLNLMVHNNIGQLVLDMRLSAHIGENSFNIPAARLAQGINIVSVYDQHGVMLMSTKVIKE